MDDGTPIDKTMIGNVISGVVEEGIKKRGKGKYVEAGELMKSTCMGEGYEDFLTVLIFIGGFFD